MEKFSSPQLSHWIQSPTRSQGRDYFPNIWMGHGEMDKLGELARVPVKLQQNDSGILLPWASTEGFQVVSVHLCHKFIPHNKCHLLKESNHITGVSPNSDSTHREKEKHTQITILQSRPRIGPTRDRVEEPVGGQEPHMLSYGEWTGQWMLSSLGHRTWEWTRYFFKKNNRHV